MKIFKARQMYLLFIVILSVFSITGCGGGGSDGQAPVLGSGDAVVTPTVPTVVAPTVTAVAPLKNATGVPVNTKLITAAFSKAMAPATLTTASFTLAHGGTVVTGGTVTYVTTGNVATLTLPATDLLASTVYTATITTAATDTAGTPLASNYVWTFTTGAAPDVTRPRVTITVPAARPPDPTNVPTNTAITAVFSEDMAPATIASPATSFTVRNTTLGSPGTLVSGTVSYAVGSRTAIFQPAVLLTAGNTYTATITTAATDLAGNQLAGNQAVLPAASDYVWSWSTAPAVVIPPVVVVDTTPPTVTFTAPVNGATDVPLNQAVSATFSEPMDPLTITNFTFTVTGAGLPVPGGLVSYNSSTNIATFTPDDNLAPSTTYTATITTGAKDLAGNALVVPAVGGLPKPNPWTFTTGTGLAPGAADLKSVAPFGTFGGSAGMTNTGTLTQIHGDIGTIATGTSSVTGFHDINGDIYTETGSNIGAVNGTIYTCTTSTTGPTATTVNAANCALATQARLDAVAAYNALAAMLSDGALAGNLASTTIYPGVYTNASAVIIQGGDLTLDALGDANAVFVFQVGSSLTVGGPGAAFPQSIILAGGAQAKNVFWQVGSNAIINAAGGGTMVGTIIAQSGVVFSTADNVNIVTLEGRALSLVSSVTMVNTVINVPAP